MDDKRCRVCGHINSPDAHLCDVCESSLGGPESAAAGEQSYTYGEGANTYGAGADAPPAFVPSTRFEGVGNVFGPTLEVYRKNFLLIVILVVVATVPQVILRYGLMQVLTSTQGDARYAAMPGSLLVWLVSVVGGAMLSGSLAYAILDLQLAGSASARESLLRGLKVLPRVALINLLYALVVGIGYLLLIVPGVIWSLKYALVIPIAVAEKRGVTESFDRSSQLTNGYKGLIFLTYFLWVIAIAVIGFIVGGSFGYAGRQSPFMVALAQALVIGVLNSSTAVLTVFIYLGLLHERRHGFYTRTFTPAGNPAER
jgi:hypothetical protein